jgi:hypothetical protein
MRKKRLTVTQTTKMMNLSQQRIMVKMKEGHFPGFGKCECGQRWMIPLDDIERDLKKTKLRKSK